MIPTPLPVESYPWQRVATDLFHLKGADYLPVVDYFSRYPQILKLTSITSHSIIKALKTIFSQHGVPETVMSDNGPQYVSQEFAEFSETYDFSHVTSSPHFPQSNGQAEHMALLSYRSTPFPWCNHSPADGKTPMS